MGSLKVIGFEICTSQVVTIVSYAILQPISETAFNSFKYLHLHMAYLMTEIVLQYPEIVIKKKL